MRKPALHFVVIGTLLFAWHRSGGAAPSAAVVAREAIVVSQERLQELRDTFTKLTGRAPSEAEERPLLGEFIDEEILYREARARGLDRNDRSVRWRLIEKMRFLSGIDEQGGDPEQLYREALELGLDRDDAILRRLLSEKMRLLIQLGAVQEDPDDTALQAYFAQHAEDYRQAARATLTQVFLSADKRGAALGEDAAALRAKLADTAPRLDAALDIGDVFPLGQHFKESSERSLAKLFGPDFAAAALRAPIGAWSEPIRSAYGLHLVWVYSRSEASLPALDAVRNQVRQRYLNERRESAFAAELVRLRDGYDVRLEGSEVTRRASEYFEKTT